MSIPLQREVLGEDYGHLPAGSVRTSAIIDRKIRLRYDHQALGVPDT
jgi:hypothetical protein